MEDWTSLGQQKRKPEFPVVTRNPATTREKPRCSLFIARCGHCLYSVSKEVLRSILKCDTVLCTFDATPKVPRHTGLTGGEHRGSRHHLICAPSPLLIATGGPIPLLCLQGVLTCPAHLRMRPVSLGNSRRRLVGDATCRKTPISRSTLNKNPMPWHLFESKPVDECTTRKSTDIPMHSTEKHAYSKHRSTSVLSSLEELERHAEFRSSKQEKA